MARREVPHLGTKGGARHVVSRGREGGSHLVAREEVLLLVARRGGGFLTLWQREGGGGGASSPLAERGLPFPPSCGRAWGVHPHVHLYPFRLFIGIVVSCFLSGKVQTMNDSISFFTAVHVVVVSHFPRGRRSLKKKKLFFYRIVLAFIERHVRVRNMIGSPNFFDPIIIHVVCVFFQSLTIYIYIYIFILTQTFYTISQK